MSKELKEKENIQISSFKYGFFSKVPSWLKILILKIWAAGAAIFFFGMGGQSFGVGSDDGTVFYVLLTLGFALVFNYIVKPIVYLMKSSRDNVLIWIFIKKKGFLGFIFNLVYCFILMFPFMMISLFLISKNIVIDFFGLGVKGIDPILGGLVFVLLDMICVFLKIIFQRVVKIIRYRKYYDDEE